MFRILLISTLAFLSNPTPAVAEVYHPDPVGVTWAAAQNNGLPRWMAREMVETVRCESQFKHRARGDNGLSYGPAQLYKYGSELPAFYAMGYSNPDDWQEATDFMAKRWKQGKRNAWSCSVILFGRR